MNTHVAAAVDGVHLVDERRVLRGVPTDEDESLGRAFSEREDRCGSEAAWGRAGDDDCRAASVDCRKRALHRKHTNASFDLLRECSDDFVCGCGEAELWHDG